MHSMKKFFYLLVCRDGIQELDQYVDPTGPVARQILFQIA